jgi:SSS family solute:Na+ symporter
VVYGTWVAYDQASPAQKHFGSPLARLPFTDILVYIACTAFIINVLVAVILTVVLRALKVDPGVDQTSPSDYGADVGDVGVEEEVDAHQPAHA